MSDSAQSRRDGEELRSAINRRMVCTVAAEPSRASTADLYQGLAQVAREQLAQRWVDTQNTDRENKARRIYYLSMEFLIGRAMNNALSALDLRDQAAALFTALHWILLEWHWVPAAVHFGPLVLLNLARVARLVSRPGKENIA